MAKPTQSIKSPEGDRWDMERSDWLGEGGVVATPHFVE